MLTRLQAVQALEEVATWSGIILQHRRFGAQSACEEGEEVQPSHLHSLLPLLAVLLQGFQFVLASFAGCSALTKSV